MMATATKDPLYVTRNYPRSITTLPPQELKNWVPTSNLTAMIQETHHQTPVEAASYRCDARLDQTAYMVQVCFASSSAKSRTPQFLCPPAAPPFPGPIGLQSNGCQ